MKPEALIAIVVPFALAAALLYRWLRQPKRASGRFRLPKGIDLIAGPNGPVFRGPAAALFPAITEFLRRLACKPVGSRVKVGGFMLCCSNEIPAIPDPWMVVLPPDAWGIVAAKFAEVATGLEESPFYFGDCGYLWPRPEPDVGIGPINFTIY